MKTNITVSLCISRDFEVEVEDVKPDNLFDAFILQYGLPSDVSEYETKDKWLVDNIEIINNNE